MKFPLPTLQRPPQRLIASTVSLFTLPTKCPEHFEKKHRMTRRSQLLKFPSSLWSFYTNFSLRTGITVRWRQSEGDTWLRHVLWTCPLWMGMLHWFECSIIWSQFKLRRGYRRIKLDWKQRSTFVVNARSPSRSENCCLQWVSRGPQWYCGWRQVLQRFLVRSIRSHTLLLYCYYYYSNGCFTLREDGPAIVWDNIRGCRLGF